MDEGRGEMDEGRRKMDEKRTNKIRTVRDKKVCRKAFDNAMEIFLLQIFRWRPTIGFFWLINRLIPIYTIPNQTLDLTYHV